MTHLSVSRPCDSKISVHLFPGWSVSTNLTWSGASDAWLWTQTSSDSRAMSPKPARSSGVHVGMNRGITHGCTSRDNPDAPGWAFRM